MLNTHNPTGHILIIEDDPDGRRSVQDAVEDAGFNTTVAASAADGLEAFNPEIMDAVLTDLVLPDQDGIALLQKVRSLCPEMPVLIMTAYGSVPSSVEAMKAGAYDYLSKPLDLDELQTRITRAVETRRLRQRVTELEASENERYAIRHIIAASPAMRTLLGQVQALADTRATVLILGESGTGKEVIARALHAESPRAGRPWVAVNCGAFSETLLESEIFGHEKGSFTGASAMHRGAFERADGGTLFLDEIGDAPASVQVKLLRILEQRELIRVGGQTTIPLDVRVISASNQDLEEKVAAGAFREDLFYRLNVVTLHIPPLRQRREDIRPMTDHFIAQACRDHGRNIQEVDPEVYRILEQEPWPGNVRQLKNRIESAVVMAPTPVLNTACLPVPTGTSAPATTQLAIPPGMTLQEVEREVLAQTLRHFSGNRTLTAERLGLSRRTIQRKIQEHNLPF